MISETVTYDVTETCFKAQSVSTACTFSQLWGLLKQKNEREQSAVSSGTTLYKFTGGSTRIGGQVGKTSQEREVSEYLGDK